MRINFSKWDYVFLGSTALAITMEIIGSFDQSDSTHPWTEMITEYVPVEVTFASIGALSLWLVIHFARRYMAARSTATGEAMGRVAYTRYTSHRGGLNHLGERCPDWEDLPAGIREAWTVSAVGAAADVVRARSHAPLVDDDGGR